MSHKIKILTVDDEQINLAILSEYLESAGYDFILASDGVEAIEIMEKSDDIDAVVLDRMMPRLDGMGVLKWIKQSEIYKNTPVIMQTAAATSEQVLQGIESGVYHYLTKPYSEPLFLAVLKSALDSTKDFHETTSEFKKMRNGLAMCSDARFSFQNLSEAQDLSLVIANFYPDPSKVILGINELLVNAIEHGNLGIAYEEKKQLLLSGKWHSEISNRILLPEHRNKYATASFARNEKELSLNITDEGIGFDWSRYLDFDPKRMMDPNGRGIATAKNGCFDELEFLGSGNQVRCKILLQTSE